VTGTGNDVLPEYTKQPPNDPSSNDPGSTYEGARGSGDYSWGKVSPRFQSQGAEITPHGHGDVTRRKGTGEDYLRPAQRRALENQSRFAKGRKVSPASAWQSKSPVVAQRLARSNAPRIHAPHEGAGAVLQIHLGPVGDDAIDLRANGGRVWRAIG